MAVDQSRLSADEKRLLEIALNNDSIKNELSGREYVITSVRATNDSGSSPWIDNGSVSIDLLYPNGYVDYHLVALVDTQNNTVPFTVREKPAPPL